MLARGSTCFMKTVTKTHTWGHIKPAVPAIKHTQSSVGAGHFLIASCHVVSECSHSLLLPADLTCYCLQWRSHVGDLLQDIDDILAARSRETIALPAQHFRCKLLVHSYTCFEQCTTCCLKSVFIQRGTQASTPYTQRIRLGVSSVSCCCHAILCHSHLSAKLLVLLTVSCILATTSMTPIFHSVSLHPLSAEMWISVIPGGRAAQEMLWQPSCRQRASCWLPTEQVRVLC